MANVQQAASILVVEDDSALREALVDTLEMAKFSVHQAQSAEEALTLLAQYSAYSLIVSDVNMKKLIGKFHVIYVKEKVKLKFMLMNHMKVVTNIFMKNVIIV